MPHILFIKPLSENSKRFYQQRFASETTDSGFDLFCCKEEHFEPSLSNKIDFEIQCEMRDLYGRNVAYWLMPRSSIIKRTLRMSNSMGLIDAGYRGNIMAFVDNVGATEATIEDGCRLFQIVAPNLEPFHVKIVDELSSSVRGVGGFGSTGV